jgi:hypothetical protein
VAVGRRHRITDFGVAARRVTTMLGKSSISFTRGSSSSFHSADP